MRMVIASEMISLDGYFAGPNGEIDWFVWNEQMAKYAVDLLARVDMILFGRVTYEGMASYWPTAAAKTENPIVVDKMNDLPKIVFSKKLQKVEWKNSTLIEGDAAEEVSKMRRQPGKDMVIYGSSTIVQQLMEHGLIDEYHIFVNPIILGKGKPLFAESTNRNKLLLKNARTFDSGVVVLHYSHT